MALNLNEVLLDRVRSAVANDLSTGQMLLRLTSIENPSLQCTAEGEEVTDAIGAVITTMYRAKKATFSGSNSLMSLDLMAAQYGTHKEVATKEKKIDDVTYDVLTVTGTASETVKLTHKPKNSADVKYAYSIVSGEVGTAYKAGSAASETEFVIAEDGTITPPTGFKGKLYVEYIFENENALRIVNKASNFPEACSLIIYAYFRDKCNENLLYSGKIIAPKTKLNPAQIELALTSTGKHPFEFTMAKDYCNEGDDELFSVIISQE